MIEIESALAILSGATKLYDWFTGIKHGRLEGGLMEEMMKTRNMVEKLSDHIFYSSSVCEVADITSAEKKQMQDKKVVNDLMQEVHKSLQDDLLCTAVISTPERLRKAFGKDPWEVVFDVRPIGRAKKPSNPDATPIIFSEEGSYYMGWQMHGAMPALLHCEYTPHNELDLGSVPAPHQLEAGRLVAKNHLGFCRKCGMRFLLEVKFCHKCGHAIM